MTNLHFDGFDLGDSLVREDYIATIQGQSNPTTTITPFGVGRALQCNDGTLMKSFPASQEVFFGVYATCYGGGTTQTGMMQLFGDNGTVAHLTFGCTNTQVNVRLGSETGTILASGNWIFPVSPTNWRHIQGYAKIADSGGRVIVKVDDLVVIDYTGDTKSGGTNVSVDQFRFNRFGNAAAFYYDDWWINDAAGAAPHNTFYGMARCRLLAPTAPGASTGFTPSTGANWSCVDETPYVATDYVSNPGAVSGTRDTYVAADIGTGNEVLAARSLVVAKKTGPGLLSLKPVLRSGGADYYGPTTLLAGSDRSMNGVWYTDPATGVPWTVAGVNAAEVGFEVA